MVKLRLLLLFVFVILFLSCRKENASHLPPDKMQRVLFDVHLAETYSMNLHQDSARRNVERNLDSLAVFYKSIFKQHNISQEEFEQSLKWYMQNPETLDTIYARLITEMSKLEAKYN